MTSTRKHQMQIQARKPESANFQLSTAMVDRAPVGIFETTMDGRFKRINTRLAEIFGWESPQTMIAEIVSIKKQLHVDRRICDTFLLALRSRKELIDYRLPMKRKDGSHFWASVSLAVTPGPEGEILGTEGFLFDVTRQVEIEEALKENESNLRTLTDTTTCAIFILQEGYCRYLNPAAELLCGRNIQSLSRTTFDDIFVPEHRDFFRKKIENLKIFSNHADPPNIELSIAHPRGEERWMETQIKHITFNAEPSLLITGFDITERKKNEQISRAMFDISNAVSMTRDITELYAFIFQTLQELTSAPNFFIGLVEESEDRIVFPFYHDERDEYINIENISDPNNKSLVLHVLRTQKTLWATGDEIGQLMQEGTLNVIGSFPAVWVGVPLIIKGRVLGVLCVQDYENPQRFQKRDVDLIISISEQIGMAIERKLYEDQLAHMALHDELTGLPNRTLFLERLNRALHRARRRPEYHFSVLMLDLDRFKMINDSYGHKTGDLLLQAVAQRLSAVLREMDTMARLGGDEFGILLEELRSPRETILIVKRIKAILCRPLIVENLTLHTGAGIGVVLDCQEYSRGEDMLRDADIAMYQAKNQGKNRYRVFNRRMHTRAVELLEVENMIRQALKLKEFTVAYQPILSSADQKLVGFEALARWNHPRRGDISPVDFIPVAEESGLIIPLGEAILETACTDMVRWLNEFPLHMAGVFVSVNLSPKQLVLGNFADRLQRILDKTGLAPDHLKLEITESAIMENADTALDALRKINTSGVRLAIDDFGTGYSSLSYLQRFPVRTIKIDRSFVSDLESNKENYEIIRAILALAHSLNMDVIAEGVEENTQFSILKKLACESVQGFLFCRPMNPLGLRAFLSSQFR